MKNDQGGPLDVESGAVITRREALMSSAALAVTRLGARAGIPAVLGGVASVQTASAQPTRPNIVYIVADDMGWGDVGFHGSDIATPNLDQLAGEGARLEQFYA